MAQSGNRISIADDETVYRRIPVAAGWFDGHGVSPSAFSPNENDTEGLSVYRASFLTAEQVALTGRSSQGYYVAALRVGDIRAAGLSVEDDDPAGVDPGHAKIAELNARVRRSESVQRWKVHLAKQLVLRVEGPFPPGPAGHR